MKYLENMRQTYIYNMFQNMSDCGLREFSMNPEIISEIFKNTYAILLKEFENMQKQAPA